MCGRLVGVKNKIELEHRIRQLTDPAFWDYLQRTSDEFSRISSLGNYNASPSQFLTVLSERLIDGELVPSIDDAFWGLLPVWAKDRSQGSRAFNARSETADSKPTFRSAYTKRRALIPASGYYEWQKHSGGTKQPFYIYPEAGEGFFFAGLYEWWQEDKADADSWLMSCTVLTADASEDMRHIHDRMPIIMPDDLGMDWMSPGTTSKADVAAMIDEAVGRMPNTLTARPVGPDVGNVRNNRPELILPA